MSLQDKTLVVFHSYKTSFSVLNEAGILDRELKLYRELKPRFKEIMFVSYATDLAAEQALAPDFRVLGNVNNLHPMLYALTAWIPHVAVLRQATIFRINQMSGFLLAGPAKLRFWNKTLIVRCGFMWSKFQKHNNVIKKFGVMLIEWLAFRCATGIIVTAHADKNFTMQRYNINEDRITVIRNLTDTEMFSASDQKPNLNWIGAVGRLEPQKNYDALIQALSGSKYELHIFGDGSLRKDLEQQATTQQTQVTFHGVIPNTELPRALSACSAFVLASHYEGNPKALLEAMALGLPVIASNIEAHRDVIIDGQNGVLSERSPVPLRSAIDYVMTSPEFAQKLGAAAREWIIDNASLPAILKQEVNLYESLS